MSLRLTLSNASSYNTSNINEGPSGRDTAWTPITAACGSTYCCFCCTHSLRRANLLRLSRNSLLPPWWKCRAGREMADSFSLKTKKVQPSSFTVMDLRSLTLNVNAHRLFSWLWFIEPDRPHTGSRKQHQQRDNERAETSHNIHCSVCYHKFVLLVTKRFSPQTT